MKKRSWKSYFNFIFLVLVFSYTMWSVFHGEDLNQVLTYLQTANPLYIILGVVCVILFILGESVCLHYLMRTLGTKVKMGHCCLYSFIGFFYSSITPSASGGQPMQMIAMRKDKIPIAVSSVVLAIVTITYKLVLVVIGVIVLLIRPPQLMGYVEQSGAEAIIWIGLGLNVIAISLLLLLVFHPTLVRKCAVRILMWINRIRPFKNLEGKMARLDKAIGQYHGTADYYRTHKRVIVNVFLITLVQRGILFLVTWLTYLAFGLSGESLLVIVGLQALISVAADMMPLPGGMGVSETLFLQIFLPIFGQALIVPGMMISRGISFYTQTLISAVMTIAASFLIRDQNRRENLSE